LDKTTSEDEAKPLGQMKSKVANTPSNHHRFAVMEGDGYIRLEGGFSGKASMLRDIPIRECFVRRDDGHIRIGYLANVDRTDASKSRDVLWLQLWPRDRATSLGPLAAKSPFERFLKNADQRHVLSKELNQTSVYW
jgi:hypothetical protein